MLPPNLLIVRQAGSGSGYQNGHRNQILNKAQIYRRLHRSQIVERAALSTNNMQRLAMRVAQIGNTHLAN